MKLHSGDNATNVAKDHIWCVAAPASHMWYRFKPVACDKSPCGKQKGLLAFPATLIHLKTQTNDCIAMMTVMV